MTWRSIFMVRARYKSVTLDSLVQYDKADEIEAELKSDTLLAMRVACKLEGEDFDYEIHFKGKYPEAWEAAKHWESMRLRTRFNNDIHGPYNIVTEDKPTDEELLAWWEANHGTRLG